MNPPPLRVLVDLTELMPGGETGGVKHFVFEFLRRLGESAEARFEFEFLTNTATHDEVLGTLVRPRDGVACVRKSAGHAAPSPSRFGPRERVLMPSPPDLAQQLGADVAYCPFGSTTQVGPGVPIVALVVDLLHRDFPDSLPPEIVRQREALFNEMTRRASFFQCNSRHVASRLRGHYEVPRAVMFHTYNVVHERLDRCEIVPAPATCPATPFFFYPANTWLHKNHERLFIAYESYRAMCGNEAWPLVLAGYETERADALKKSVAPLIADGSVVFLGHVSDEELAAVWRRAGALIFPSLHEGFGIPLLEAMHFSVPIACSSTSSLPEVADGAALQFDPRSPAAISSALHKLTTEISLRTRLVKAGRRRLAGLSADTEVGKLAGHLLRASRAWPPPGSTGHDADGWVCGVVVFGLPELALDGGDLSFRIHDHAPGARFVVSAGSKPLGTFSPADYRNRVMKIPVAPGTRSVALRVVGGENLNPADPRIHGARFERVEFSGRSGTRTLYKLDPTV